MPFDRRSLYRCLVAGSFAVALLNPRGARAQAAARGASPTAAVEIIGEPGITVFLAEPNTSKPGSCAAKGARRSYLPANIASQPLARGGGPSKRTRFSSPRANGR